MAMDMRNCPICGEKVVNDDGIQVAKLTKKGVEGIHSAAAARGVAINIKPGDEVHYPCRSNFCNKKLIEQDHHKRQAEDCPSITFISPMKRRSTEQFAVMSDCCFCGRQITEKSFRLKLAFKIKTMAFQEAILKACEERKDRWSITVVERIASAGDLYAADAVYHQMCSVNFRTGKPKPTKYSTSAAPVKRGRPKDEDAENAFAAVVEEICADDEVQWTIPQVQARMSELCEVPYSAQYIKAQLSEELGDSITISNVQGRAHVITFKTTVAQILQDFHDTPTCIDEDAEKLRILSAAAAIIRSETIHKCASYDKEYYPDPVDLQSIDKMLDFVPDSMRLLLDELISSKSKALKMASLGQCLVQAIRPRAVLAPLQIGLAIQFHHYSGAKFLIDTLCSHGYSSSYDEVLRFESCSAAQAPMTSDVGNDANVRSVLNDNGHFRQFVCDNADRNPWTLDGKKALHAMGIIETITPAIRQKARIKRENPASLRNVHSPGIPIQYYDRPKNNDPTVYARLRQLKRDVPVSLLDVLWTVGWPLKVDRLGWTGFMNAVEKGEHEGRATVRFLPMIDMDPTNMSCIYSTLMFLSNECSRHKCTPIVTFDSPLYWKARIVISNKEDRSALKQIVLDLGGFHTMMSFIGSIGHVMHNSGLSEILRVVIGENAVKSIMSGKAYSRAVRAHLMTTSALHALLLQETYGMPLLVDESGEKWEAPPDLQVAVDCFDSVLEGKALTPIQELTLRRIFCCVQKTEERLNKNRTSALFIEYTKMVTLLRDFIRAQRSSDWNLHKSCLKEMLPYFAATGHNQYTKCVHVYLQDLEDLESSNPDVYKKLESGLFVIRRTDRFWAGLSKDLVIETTLMRTMKCVGGLTHGRGVMEEKTRTRWLMSLPMCATMNEAMQELTGQVIATSEQHKAKDAAPARVAQDNKDTFAILQFLNEYNPFSESDDLNLRNIVSGLTSKISNADQVRTIGKAILEQMSGNKVKDYNFTRKAQIAQIGVEKQMKIDGESVPIDSDLIFHRLLAAGQLSEEENALENLFKHELSTYPSSLFDDNGLMRTAVKSQLADAIAAICPALEYSTETLTVDINVVDGGSLLHKVIWQKDSMYKDICSNYVRTLQKMDNPIVIFDGYKGPSTKDMTHFRRSKVNGPKIQVTENRVLKTTKDKFLSNESNKSDFISLLMTHIETRDGMKCEQATADADLMIAMKGVHMSSVGPTCVIAEDTDVLVLLIYHASRASVPAKQLYLRSDRQNSKHVWDIGAACEAFGKDLCRLLPFAHAICGSDTTSRLFGIGKSVPLKKLQPI